MNERKPEQSDFEVHTDEGGEYFPFFETEGGDQYIGWGHIDHAEFKTAVGKYLDMCLDAADRAEWDTDGMTVSHTYAYLEGEDPEHDEFYVKVCPADHALAAAITIGSF